MDPSNNPIVAEIDLQEISFQGIRVAQPLKVSLSRNAEHGYHSIQLCLPLPYLNLGDADDKHVYTLRGSHQQAALALDQVLTRLRQDIQFYDSLPDDSLTSVGKSVKALFVEYFVPDVGDFMKVSKLQRQIDKAGQQAVVEELAPQLDAQAQQFQAGVVQGTLAPGIDGNGWVRSTPL